MSSNDSGLIIPVYGGQNFAPAKPLLDLREGNEKPSHYLADALKERFRHFTKKDENARNEMIEVGRLVDEFIQGRQIFGVNPYNGEIRSLPIRRQDDSTRRAISLMQFFAELCERKWMDSNPNVRVQAAADMDNAVAAARAAGFVVDHFESKWFTDLFNRREGGLAMRWGTYINRVRHDPGITGITATRQILEAVPQVFGAGFGRCAECKYGGEAAEFGVEPQMEAPDEMGEMDQMGDPGPMPQCPRCKSQAVLVQAPPVAKVPQVVGSETIEMGDFRLDQLELPACYWDLASMAEDSSYFIYRQSIPMGEIVRLLGNIKVPNGSSQESDKGLAILEGLARSGQALSGKSATNRSGQKSQIWQDRVTLDEMWLSPCDYADITLKGDEQTIDGVPVPPGAKLADVAPDGLVAVGLNGMGLILGLYREKHRDHLASGVWHMRPHSGAGRGVVDAVEVQMRINKYDNQVNRSMDASTPGGFYDPGIVGEDEVKLAYKPGVFAPVDLSKLPSQDRDIRKAVYPVPPTNVSGLVIQYGQQFLKEMMQFSFGIMDFSDGLPGVKNTTLGGAQLGQALSESVFTPILKTKAHVRKRIAELTIALYRKHVPLPRSIALKNRYGGRQALMLAGADLDADIAFEVVRDSEAPRNTFTKRDDAANFLQIFGGNIQMYLMLKQQFPTEIGAIEQAFQFELGAGDDFDVVALRCQQRMEGAKQAVQMGAMVPQEILLFVKPALSVAENKHVEKRRWYQDWLDTDEGVNAPPPLRTFAEFMAATHQQLDGEQQAFAVMSQAAPLANAGAGPDGHPLPPPEQNQKPQGKGNKPPAQNSQQQKPPMQKAA